MTAEPAKEFKSYLEWAHEGRSQWWLYLIGYLILQVIFVVGNMWFGILISLVFPGLESTVAGAVVWAGLSFLPTFIAIPVLTLVLHKRPWWSVAMPMPRLERKNLATGFLAAWLLLLASYSLYALFGGVHLSFRLPELGTYLPLFVFGLLALFVQGSAEELFFRGYVMQFARRITSSPVLIILASAFLFARPHLSNLGGLGMPDYAIILYAIDGIFVAWLAYRTGSIWMPAGFHVGNNFGLMVLVAEAESKDLIHGEPVLVTDAYASVNLQIVVAIVVYSLIAILLHALIKRRERAVHQ